MVNVDVQTLWYQVKLGLVDRDEKRFSVADGIAHLDPLCPSFTVDAMCSAADVFTGSVSVCDEGGCYLQPLPDELQMVEEVVDCIVKAEIAANKLRTYRDPEPVRAATIRAAFIGRLRWFLAAHPPEDFCPGLSDEFVAAQRRLGSVLEPFPAVPSDDCEMLFSRWCEALSHSIVFKVASAASASYGLNLDDAEDLPDRFMERIWVAVPRANSTVSVGYNDYRENLLGLCDNVVCGSEFLFLKIPLIALLHTTRVLKGMLGFDDFHTLEELEFLAKHDFVSVGHSQGLLDAFRASVSVK